MNIFNADQTEPAAAYQNFWLLRKTFKQKFAIYWTLYY
jgi:hypothetical protein